MKATIIRPTNMFLLDKPESDSKGKQGVAKSADRTDGQNVVKGWQKEVIYDGVYRHCASMY